MRNTLSELPVLLCCLWGGALAGGLAFLLTLPKKLWFKRFRGRRRPALTALLFGLGDIIAGLSIAAVFALTLLYANGGELRLYAVCGFIAALAAVLRLCNMLL